MVLLSVMIHVYNGFCNNCDFVKVKRPSTIIVNVLLKLQYEFRVFDDGAVSDTHWNEPIN